jgi:hypothetical protein
MYLFSCLLGSLLRYAFGSRAYTLTMDLTGREENKILVAEAYSGTSRNTGRYTALHILPVLPV